MVYYTRALCSVKYDRWRQSCGYRYRKGVIPIADRCKAIRRSSNMASAVPEYDGCHANELYNAKCRCKRR